MRFVVRTTTKRSQGNSLTNLAFQLTFVHYLLCDCCCRCCSAEKARLTSGRSSSSRSTFLHVFLQLNCFLYRNQVLLVQQFWRSNSLLTYAHFQYGCCCCSHINSHNQVRGHRTGSSHSGAEEYPREKTHTAAQGASCLISKFFTYVLLLWALESSIRAVTFSSCYVPGTYLVCITSMLRNTRGYGWTAGYVVTGG